MQTLRRHAFFAIWFAVATVAYLLWTRSDGIGWFGGDGVNYVLMAQHYAHAGIDRSVTAAAAYSRFPPLYPMLLAWLGTADSLRAIHAATTAFLLAALLTQYAWLRAAELDVNRAALAGLLTAVLPGTWLNGLLVQSEYLYLLWSVLALLLLAMHRRSGKDTLLYGTALAIVAATLTRTIGVTLVPALLLACRGRPFRVIALTVALVLLPLLLWYGLHSAAGDGYGDALAERYHDVGPGLLFRQAAEMAPALVRGFADNFTDLPALRILALAWGALCLVAAGTRALCLQADGIYALSYLGLLLWWPFPSEAQRLMWVLVPVLLAQPLLAAPAAARRLLPFAAAATILAMAVPAIAYAASRYAMAPFLSQVAGTRGYLHWYTDRSADAPLHIGAEAGLVDALRRIPQFVPESECVISVRPDLVNYYGQRRSVFPPRTAVVEPAFSTALNAGHCTAVVATRFVDTRFQDVMYPLGRLDGRFEVLDYLDLSIPASTPPQTFYLLARLTPAG